MSDEVGFHDKTALELLIDGFLERMSREPIAVGACIGLVAGAMTDSGIVLFAATFVAWAFGLRLQKSRHVRAP